MGKSTAKARVTKRVEQNRRWVQRSADYTETLNLGAIRRALKDGTLVSLVLLASDASSLGLAHGTRGLVSLVEGKKHGWSQVAAALEWYLWSARLMLKQHYAWPPAERKARGSFLCGTVPFAVCLMAQFVAADDFAREREVWSLLQKPMVDTHPWSRWWRARYFEPFFLKLYAEARGCPLRLKSSREDLGVYSRVLEHWDDDHEVARRLAGACDYHLLNTESTRDWDAEFKYPPFDLIPIEVFAVNRLRQQMGLRAVTVEHPLLDVVGPIVAAKPQRELVAPLKQIREKYLQFFPEDSSML
jgi:hypothetical protein